jgi:hypothetical protein
MVLYYFLCSLLALGGRLWARLLKLEHEPARAWFMAACALAALVFWWAALRSLQRLRTPDHSLAAQ